ncbi:MAG: hypothetical protein P4L84_02255 [Isosphaeraceae bacterium]|nr:hypothetical protein [Isosphaeraceae bacterium]
MRKVAIGVTGVIVVVLVAVPFWWWWSAVNDPQTSVLKPGTQCVVTPEGVVRTEEYVMFEGPDIKSMATLEPGVVVRVGKDPGPEGQTASWMRKIQVTVESGEHKDTSGYVSREYLRPLR